MPFRIKTALAGYWQGWLYFTSGQRDRGPITRALKKFLVVCGEQGYTFDASSYDRDFLYIIDLSLFLY